MAFREVGVVEVREVLRGWLEGGTLDAEMRRLARAELLILDLSR